MSWEVFRRQDHYKGKMEMSNPDKLVTWWFYELNIYIYIYRGRSRGWVPEKPPSRASVLVLVRQQLAQEGRQRGVGVEGVQAGHVPSRAQGLPRHARNRNPKTEALVSWDFP